jgi:hypothetical protein
MAAGQGFKTFTTGEVLTAGDVNGYLMQGVLVFASTAARDAAITSPQEGQFAFTKDTNGLWYYDGAAWVASGATGDIEGVTAGTGISGGGTSGTVTITNSMATAIDAKGDLVVGTGADTFSKLTVGANATVLTADSAAATGLKWATPSAAATSFTLLNAGGTALTGSTTVTVSGISGYNQYLVYLTGASTANSSAIVAVRINADTSANYHCPAIYFEPAATIGDAADESATKIRLGRTGQAESLSVFGNVLISAGNSTGKKPFSAQGMGNGNSVYRGYTTIGFYQGTSVISSISAFSESGNFDDGLILVYGA